MRDRLSALTLAVIVSLCGATLAPLWAEEASPEQNSPDEVAQLRAENTELKAKITQLEGQIAKSKKVNPADIQQPAEPNPLEKIVEPILVPATYITDHAEDVASSGWWGDISEGFDRVDHFFYVEDSKAWATTELELDTRGFTFLNFTGASRLPAGFNLWGFIDLESTDAEGNRKTDLNKFFTEIDLKREVWKGLGGIAEYNDGSGRRDNVGRFGAYYAPTWAWLKKIDLVMQTKWFPIGTEESRRQGSLGWNWTPRYILDGRFSMGGFYDLNFNEVDGEYRKQTVSDTSFRFRLLGNLNAIVKYRYNQFLSKDQESGWSIGALYRF